MFYLTLGVPCGVIYDATQNLEMDYSKEEYFEKCRLVSYDATWSLEVILVASCMTPTVPLSNRVKPGFSSVNLIETEYFFYKIEFAASIKQSSADKKDYMYCESAHAHHQLHLTAPSQFPESKVPNGLCPECFFPNPFSGIPFS
ncbi:hypothetical protein V9T40_002265 [Parthenolecanium corni]|uniref:Uncharacterized protein n=1 Tax=Parthenolecanium corni TaxID=536013 RepID=A0AAN9TU83_9HEMI